MADDNKIKSGTIDLSNWQQDLTGQPPTPASAMPLPYAPKRKITSGTIDLSKDIAAHQPAPVASQNSEMFDNVIPVAGATEEASQPQKPTPSYAPHAEKSSNPEFDQVVSVPEGTPPGLQQPIPEKNIVTRGIEKVVGALPEAPFDITNKIYDYGYDLLGRAVPNAAVPALSVAKKIAVDPFEKAAQAGAEYGTEMARAAGGVYETLRHPLTLQEEPEARFEAEHPYIAGGAEYLGGLIGGMAADPRQWPLLFETLGAKAGAVSELPATQARPFFQRVATGAFGTQMTKNAADAATDLALHWDEMTPKERSSKIAEVVATGYLGKKGLEQGFEGQGKTVKKVLGETAKAIPELVTGEEGAEIGEKVPKKPKVLTGPKQFEAVKPVGGVAPTTEAPTTPKERTGYPPIPEKVETKPEDILTGPEQYQVQAQGGETPKEETLTAPKERAGYPPIEIPTEEEKPITREETAEANKAIKEREAEKPKGRVFYHGSDEEGARKIADTGKLSSPFDTHLTPDRSTAEAYAKMKGGQVHEVREEDIPKGVLDHFNETGRGPIVIPRGTEIPIGELRKEGEVTPRDMETINKGLVAEGIVHPAEKAAQVRATQPKEPLTPNDVIDHVSGRKDHAILTAENPNNVPFTPEQNAKRMNALRKLVEGMGYRVTEVVGHMPQGLENAFYVEGMDPHTAAELGKRFEQAAVVTGEGIHDLKKNTVIPYKTADHPLLDDDARKQEYYSTVKGADGTERAFSHQPDWDRERGEKAEAPKEKAPAGETSFNLVSDVDGKNHTLEIKSGDKVVGHLGIEEQVPDTWTVHTAAVTPSETRQGFGTQAHLRAFEEARKAGMKFVESDISITDKEKGVWDKLKGMYPGAITEENGQYTADLSKLVKAASSPERDTDILVQVKKDMPNATLSEQLMEAGRRAQKTEQAKPEAESGGQNYSRVETHVGDLTNNNLRELAKAVGLDPAKYDFSKRVALREGGSKHPVERIQMVKDIMTKLKPEDIERIGEQSITGTPENVGGSPARSQKARSEDAEKLLRSLWEKPEEGKK